MANDGLYWQRIEGRQDTATAAAREGSPVTVQVPKTGQQLVLERSFQHSAAPGQAQELATVKITLIADQVYHRAELGVWVAGLAFVLAFRFAVLRLRAWVEVLIVAVFLCSEVMLELFSPVLADGLLKSGCAGLLLVAACTGAAEVWRRVNGRALAAEVAK